MAVRTRRRKFSRPMGAISTTPTPHGEMRDGYVCTTFGIVEVLAIQGGSGDMTALIFYYLGYEYRRRFDKYYAPSHIITLAQRFATDVRWERWEDGEDVETEIEDDEG